MDATEVTELVRRHAGLIHRIARVYGRDAADREDVAQEVALQLWRSRESYDPGRRESTWIYRVALNVAISFQRRERRHREGRLSDDAHLIALTEDSPEPDPRVELLLCCVDELGALEKALVLLHLDGNDHPTIADVLGISVSNVGTKLGRIKDELRDALERRARREHAEEPHAAR